MSFSTKECNALEITEAVQFLKFHTKEINGHNAFNMQLHGQESEVIYPQQVIERPQPITAMSETEIDTYKNVFNGVLSGQKK